MLNNKGFTFIEALIVLATVLIISSLLLMFHDFKVNDEVVLKQLTYTLYEAKLNSMVYKEKTKLEFKSSCLYITSDHINKEVDFRNTYFENALFSYNKEGHINEGGHIDFKINNQSYNLKFHLGSGCFEIE